MRLAVLACAVGVSWAWSASDAWCAPPLLANGPARSQSEEDANELTAFTWHRNIMGGDRALGLSLTERNYIQHDVEEPSGSIEFVNFFTQPGGAPPPEGVPRTPANAALKQQADAARAAGQPLPASAPRPAAPLAMQTRLMAITDGDLTMGIYASRGAGDPGRFFGSNLYEIKNGKLTQEWYSGPTFKLPAGAAANADYARWYPGPYQELVNIRFLVPITPATRAQREANKRLVSEFWDGFFVRKRASAAKRLAPTLVNHIEGQPSGREFAAFARQHPEQVTSKDVRQTLFLIGEGDLVAIGFPVPLLDDPGAWYAQNVVRVKDGRIVEWWYSGYPEGTPVLRYGAAWPIGAGPRPGTTD